MIQYEHYQKDLNSIVSYIDILNSVPDAELAHVEMHAGSILPLRSDEEVQRIAPDDLLACSPKKIVNHQIAVDNIMH